MKIQHISYNNLIDVVKEKIGFKAVKLHHTKGAANKENVSAVKPGSINKKELLKEIREFLKKIEHSNYSVDIKFHQKTKTYVIKIIDNETKRVVAEAPLEKILDIISFMEERINQKRFHYRR